MLQVPTIVDTVALGWVSKLYLTICFRNVTLKQFDNQIKLVGVFTRRNLSFSQRAQTMKKSDTWFRFIIRNIYNLLILGGVIFSSYLVGKYTFERVVSVDSHLRWENIPENNFCLLSSFPSKTSSKKSPVVLVDSQLKLSAANYVIKPACSSANDVKLTSFAFQKVFQKVLSRIGWQPIETECRKLCHQTCSFFCQWCQTYVISNFFFKLANS